MPDLPFAGPPFPGSRYAAELGLALEAVREAGAILLQGRTADQAFTYKADRSIVTPVDERCARHLDARIARGFPDDAILDEETYVLDREEPDWHRARRCWIVDPLDSTSSYVRGGSDYGILIGLTEEGMPVVGMTLKPETRELFYAARGEGAFRAILGAGGGLERVHPVRVSRERALKLVVSRGRQTQELADLIAKLGNPPFTRMNGAMKLNEVARGACTAFVSPANHPMSLWDLCATQCILVEAGGRLTDLAGGPIDFRSPNPVRSGGFIASNGEVHGEILARLARAGDAPAT